MKRYSILLSVPIILFASMQANAQWFYTSSFSGAWSSTWNNPISATSSVMIQGAINRKMLEQSIANQQGRHTNSGGVANGAASAPARAQSALPPTNYAVLRFRPATDSGVPKKFADALGTNPQERAALLEAFQEVKRTYEAEAAKDGKSNNIAAAMTFFLVASSMAYHQTGEPADNVADALVEVLQEQLSVSPDFKSMPDRQKQEMHDWLVVAGGLILTGYLDGVNTNDAKELADYKALADASFRLVLGTGPEKFNLAAIK